MAVLYPPLAVGRTPTDAGIPVLADPQLNRRQMPAAARHLDAPLALLRRVAATTGRSEHLPGAQRKWLTAGDRAIERLLRDVTGSGEIHARAYAVADWRDLRHAAHRLNHRLSTAQVPTVSPVCDFPRGRIVVAPCRWRESQAPLVLWIREATEPICGRCRRDRSGIDWPAGAYDSYRL